jgi:hypothetical protein
LEIDRVWIAVKNYITPNIFDVEPGGVAQRLADARVRRWAAHAHALLLAALPAAQAALEAGQAGGEPPGGAYVLPLLSTMSGLDRFDPDPVPAHVELARAHGGFALLERQVLAVLDPSHPGGQRSILPPFDDIVEKLGRLCGLTGEPDPEFPRALAATSVPTALAARQAAALRAARGGPAPGGVRVVEVPGGPNFAFVGATSVGELLQQVWNHSVAPHKLPQACRAPAPPPAGAAGAAAARARARGRFAGLMAKANASYTAAELERIATEAMPALAEAMRGVLDEEAEAQQPALALAEARALATRPCANPRCIKIVGCRERDARGRRCSGCKVSRYCCRECQVAGWRAHKGVCGELGAEREAAEEA